MRKYLSCASHVVQDWTHLFDKKVIVDEKLVREFYHSLEIEVEGGKVLGTNYM